MVFSTDINPMIYWFSSFEFFIAHRFVVLWIAKNSMKQHAHGKTMTKTEETTWCLFRRKTQKVRYQWQKMIDWKENEQITIMLSSGGGGGNMMNETHFIWWFITQNAASYFPFRAAVQHFHFVRFECEEFEPVGEMFCVWYEHKSKSFVPKMRSQIATLL